MKSMFKNLSYFWEDNSKYIKAGAIILIIIAAAFLFILYGENGDKLSVNKNSYDNNKDLHSIEKNGSNSSKMSTNKKSKKNNKQSKNADGEIDASDENSMYIDIEGAVINPGVYRIKEGDRIFHAIAKAGGLKDTADIKSINKAEVLSDGQKIYIYELGEEGHSGDSTSDENSGDKVNINSADVNKLQEIEGIGPSMANRIIEYRKTNGRFKKLDDLKNVSGIGEKRFESMKNSITI